jgi:NADPH:quinone reductase
MLRAAGADHVLLESESLAAVRELFPGGVERVLELIGAGTLRDSRCCAAPGGVVCMTGMLGGQWISDRFESMGSHRSKTHDVLGWLRERHQSKNPP